MQLAAHEAYDLHELTMSCVNSITCMASFIQQAQDPELRAILEEHFPYHVRDYNMKVEYLQDAEGPAAMLPVPELNPTLTNAVQPQAQNVMPVMPRTEISTFNDREIATAYLLNLKRAGREYAWAAMEMSHPELRLFLEDAFQMNSHHAYDVWQWMVERGYYPQEAAQQTTLDTLGRLYETVPEPTMV